MLISGKEKSCKEMTSFFNLPLELRELIWKRSRFLDAKSRVGILLQKKADIREHVFEHSRQIVITLEISREKSMEIIYTNNYRYINIFVDVIDLSTISLHFMTSTQPLEVFFGHNVVRHFASRKSSINSLDKHYLEKDVIWRPFIGTYSS
jgi:hypothetical protein